MSMPLLALQILPYFSLFLNCLFLPLFGSQTAVFLSRWSERTTGLLVTISYC